MSQSDDVEEREKLLSEVQQDGATTLHQSAQKGDIKLVNDCLVDLHIDVKDKCGRTPIMYAAWSDEIEMVKHLLNLGSNISIKDHSERNILHHALQKKSMRTIKYLCVHVLWDLDVNAKDNTGRTALMYAAEAGQTEVIKALITDDRVEVNKCDEDGTTALLYAARTGQAEVIKALITDDRVELEVNKCDKHVEKLH